LGVKLYFDWTSSKDQASVPSGPPRRAHNNTTLQYKTKKHTKYTQINANKSMHSEMGPV